jgi:hypothetical protein
MVLEWCLMVLVRAKCGRSQAGRSSTRPHVIPSGFSRSQNDNFEQRVSSVCPRQVVICRNLGR